MHQEYIHTYEHTSYGAINNEKLLVLSPFRLVTVTGIYIFSRQDFNIVYLYIFYIYFITLLSSYIAPTESGHQRV